MTLPYNVLEAFDDYLECYPDEDEPGFDGVHYGGIKGIKEDAPESAKKAFKKFQAELEEAKKNGTKL